jgi:hypothetical protein
MCDTVLRFPASVQVCCTTRRIPAAMRARSSLASVRKAMHEEIYGCVLRLARGTLAVMDSVDMAVPTTTTRDGERSRGDLANRLAVSGLMAIFFAYLLMFSVLVEVRERRTRGGLRPDWRTDRRCHEPRHRGVLPHASAVASWSESSQYSGF